MSPAEKARHLRRTLRRLWASAADDGCTAAPDLIFYACCRQHDRDYQTHADQLGRPINRAEADRRLRRCMQITARGAPLFYRLLPWVYWAAVRIAGGRFWNRH